MKIEMVKLNRIKYACSEEEKKRLISEGYVLTRTESKGQQTVNLDNGQAAEPGDGQAPDSESGQTVNPDNGQAAEPGDGQAPDSESGQTVNPDNGQTAEPGDGQTPDSDNGQASNTDKSQTTGKRGSKKR